MKTYIRILLVSLLYLAGPGMAFAAEKKVVLQISDDSIKKQALVMNVADNLYKQYGKDLTLEVVAFGPGIKIMLSNSDSGLRLKSLSNKGVRLSACRNTGMKMAKMLDKKLELHEGVTYVNGGAVRIIELVEQGYTLIRP